MHTGVVMGYVNIQHRWDHNARANKYDDEEGTAKKKEPRKKEIAETKTHEVTVGGGATPHSGSPRPHSSISGDERRQRCQCPENPVRTTDVLPNDLLDEQILHLLLLPNLADGW